MSERPNGQNEVTLVSSGATFGQRFSPAPDILGQGRAGPAIRSGSTFSPNQVVAVPGDTPRFPMGTTPLSINLFWLSVVPARADAYGLCHRDDRIDRVEEWTQAPGQQNKEAETLRR